MIYIQDNTIRDGMQQTSIKKEVNSENFRIKSGEFRNSQI